MIKYYILEAINANGKQVYIDDVPNGKDCGCVCAECGENLIAKNKGNIKIHHFAHASGNDNIKCSQTALHLLAKAIIAEEKKVPIPRNGNIEFYQADTVEQEKYMNDIIPDLYALCEARPFIVEILVTHEVDEIKKQKIQQHQISAVEINLSSQTFLSRDDVRNAIYQKENITIIYDDDEQQISKRRNILLKYGKQLPIYYHAAIPCLYKKEFVNLSFCKKCVFFCFDEKNRSRIRCGYNMILPKETELRNADNILLSEKKVLFPSEARKHNESHFCKKMDENVIYVVGDGISSTLNKLPSFNNLKL
ncbi:MAG: hypothetical protein IKQ61_06775 [Spirochaetales bacterium]|nr:hypothetical protein [Spirochaetales bacterium]